LFGKIIVSSQKFDIVVVGAGHAGIEAALVGARCGLSVCLATSNIDRIGYMSCNPSIGGLAKGNIVREIDALGGEMGYAADQTCIQFKRLNSRKGPAVRGSRAQCDKTRYSAYMKNKIIGQPQIQILNTEIKSLVLRGRECIGVVTEHGVAISANTVILTTGTFMRGVMYLGMERTPGGRIGDRSTVGLSDQLKELGFDVLRLKTGTPARLHRDSIDWSKTQPQLGDTKFYPFSLRSERKLNLPQVACYLSYTNEQTHEVIRRNLHLSPMYCGMIEGVGPRYCPSIEDKITRFADKDRHQTFLEPEGLDDISIYLQGISTSLPRDVQEEFLRTIPGLENVDILKYGYAVEYDCIEPTQLRSTLESQSIDSLFLAGQINGTSGYEEAAAQGLIAGINATHKVLDRPEFILGRDQAYIGVLIDDLVTKGTKEPYRMMTSRAEYRLVLREDNTYERLSDISIRNSLIDEPSRELLLRRSSARQMALKDLRELRLVPDAQTLATLDRIGTPAILKPTTGEELLRRDELSISMFDSFGMTVPDDEFISESIEIEIKYEGYIKRQLEMINQVQRLEKFSIPADMQYDRIRGLSREEIEKLQRIKPRTLGQAQRISGVNPSAIQALWICLQNKKTLLQERNV
jgi:tRNA uridine 5-carboxymethylaminomethyl modification enzyme